MAELPWQSLVLGEQVQELYRRGRASLPTALVIGGVVSAALWGHTESLRVGTWLGALALVSVGRYLLLRRFFLKPPGPAESRLWAERFTLGSLMNGLTWGAAGLLLYPPGDLPHQILLVLSAGGLTAGAAASTTTYPRAFVAFTVPAMVPGLLRLGAEGDPAHLGVASMLGVFVLAMSAIVRGGGSAFAEASRLRFEHAALNAELEVRVQDRTRDLQATLTTTREYKALFEISGSMACIASFDGRFLQFNSIWSKTLGLSEAELSSSTILELIHADDQADAGRAIESLRQGVDRVTFEARTRCKDGSFRALTWLASCDRVAQRFYCVVHDVTEAKMLQRRLLVSDRMASVGTLAGGVAHEINNPLSYVIANLGVVGELLSEQLTTMRLTAEAELKDAVEAIQEAQEGAERVRTIVRDLKTFSRADEDRATPVDLREILESCLQMTANGIKHRARVIREYDAVPTVIANPARLGQVFLNLLLNASGAIQVGAVDKNTIKVALRTRADGRAEIEISDTGCGIDKSAMARIFDPFFTTKPIGEGTGLGLSICHGIVAALGGEILVESEFGRGSTFKVLLQPAAKLEALTPSESPGPELSPALAPSRILVIDDEPRVAAAIRRMVGRRHAVEVHTSAPEALARLATGERYDLILCDLMMPEMTGMDFHASLIRLDAKQAAKVVFITGGAFTLEAQLFLERTAAPHLEKPFGKAPLQALLETALRREEEA